MDEKHKHQSNRKIGPATYDIQIFKQNKLMGSLKIPCASIFLFLIVLASCKSPSKEKPILSETKEVATVAVPAFNKELIINIDGDSIAGYAFIAAGVEPKETVLLIAGYPGNDNNFDVAQTIRRNGKNVIHFNHRGAWGSQGNYMYSSCLDDISKLIDYFSRKNIAKDLRIDANQFTLLGRSYGGGIALIKGSQIEAVKKIIAISSVNYGSIMEKYTHLEELGGFKKYMQKQIMIHTDIDAFLQEMLDQKEVFNILSYKESLQDKKVLIIEDSDKNENWIQQLDQVEYVFMESDHNFINKRIELTELIINWLDGAK